MLDELADRFGAFIRGGYQAPNSWRLNSEIREILRKTIRQRDTRVSPIEALRLLFHRLVAEQSPYVEFSAASQRFVETIEGSEPLKARAIRDEIAQFVAVALSEGAGREPTDPAAHLAGAPYA